MPGLLTCPHCHAATIPRWRRHLTPKRLKCRACGQLSRVGSPKRAPSTSRMLLLALIGLPAVMNLVFVAIVAIVVRAPFLIWPSFGVGIVVALWLDSREPLVPLPPQKAMLRAADAVAAGGVALRAFLPLMLGLLITERSAHWLMPHVVAWLRG